MSTSRHAARRVQDSTPFRLLARGGYAAAGIVHILIGVLVLRVASGGSEQGDQTGAFTALAESPGGIIALWGLILALAALALWLVVQGILERTAGPAKDKAKGWGRRVSFWGQGSAYLALCVVAVTVALGARPDGDEGAEGASRGILAIPGGPFLLGAVGLGVGIGGVVFIVLGVRRAFRRRMTIPKGVLGAIVTAMGVVGFVAKGVALAIVGVLLTIAAVRVDPEEAGGLDGAVRALLEMPFGPTLTTSVGIGFLAYGVFCLFRARYARLDN